MAHVWQQVDMIAQEALMHLEDALIISSLTTTDKTADFLTRPNGYAIGDTVRIKTRPQYEAKEFTTTTVNQDIRESTRNMQIEKHFDVTVPITAQEKVLDLDSLVEQVIRPAAYTLAEKCDQYVGSKILNGRGLYTVGASTLYSTAADMAAARKAATLQQLNAGGRYNLLNLDLEAMLLGATWFGTWNERGPDGAANRREGSMGRTMGMDFFSSINFPVTDASHTAGTGVGVTKTAPTGTENTVGQSVLTFQSAATGTFNVGDRVQIAGMRRPCIVLTGGATPTSITLAHPLDEPVPVTAAVTTIGANTAYTVQGAIFDNSSLGLAMPVLDSPSDKPSSTASSNGYSIRVVQGYDMTTKTETISLDMLVGAEAYDGRRITLLADTD